MFQVVYAVDHLNGVLVHVVWALKPKEVTCDTCMILVHVLPGVVSDTCIYKYFFFLVGEGGNQAMNVI